MENTTFDKISRTLAGTTSRRRALRLLGGGIAGGFVAARGIDLATAQTTTGGLTTPVAGTLDGDAFSGLLSVTQFFNNGGQLAVVGDILDAAGEVISGFTALVTEATGTCDILNLTLGPLDLDLLGLVISIPNPIVLNITAEQGAGNLLGNLLCAVAGLLDRGGPVQGLVGLLNNILRALGG